MKIIEALKELPLIDKKITKNIALIAQYAAALDNGKLLSIFDSVERQKTELAALLQSNNDLVANRAKLRRDLAVTNATVNVTIGSMTKSIAEWIEYRQYGLEKLIVTYNNLNDNIANGQMRNTAFSPETGIKLVRFYDEKEKQDKLTELLEIKERIDSTLEVVNATTEMVA